MPTVVMSHCKGLLALRFGFYDNFSELKIFKETGLGMVLAARCYGNNGWGQWPGAMARGLGRAWRR